MGPRPRRAFAVVLRVSKRPWVRAAPARPAGVFARRFWRSAGWPERPRPRRCFCPPLLAFRGMAGTAPPAAVFLGFWRWPERPRPRRCFCPPLLAFRGTAPARGGVFARRFWRWPERPRPRRCFCPPLLAFRGGTSASPKPFGLTGHGAGGLFRGASPAGAAGPGIARPPKAGGARHVAMLAGTLAGMRQPLKATAFDGFIFRLTLVPAAGV